MTDRASRPGEQEPFIPFAELCTGPFPPEQYPELESGAKMVTIVALTDAKGQIDFGISDPGATSLDGDVWNFVGVEGIYFSNYVGDVFFIEKAGMPTLIVEGETARIPLRKVIDPNKRVISLAKRVEAPNRKVVSPESQMRTLGLTALMGQRAQTNRLVLIALAAGLTVGGAIGGIVGYRAGERVASHKVQAPATNVPAVER